MKISAISKDINKVFDKKEVVLHSDITNKDYKIIIDKKFRKTKITKMFNDMMERADICKKNGVIFDFTLCQWIMMLSNFTDLQFDTGKNMLETYIKECKGMENLIDLEILDKILVEFDEPEVKKIEETAKALGKFTKRLHDIEIDSVVNDIVGDEDGSI